MNLRNREHWKTLLYIFLFVTFVIVYTIGSKYQDKKALNWQFKGVVQKVKYDVQGIPTVTINNVTYNFFHLNRDSARSIEKGDTLIKVAGSEWVKLKKGPKHN